MHTHIGHILVFKNPLQNWNELKSDKVRSMTVTSTVREEKEMEGRLEGEKENLPLISDNVIIYEKKCQRTYQNAIITNKLQDTKSVYTHQLYFFQKTTGN